MDTHPFQRASLGFAPFRFVAIRRKAGGCCAYCGTVISNLCVVHDVDGREFVVGSDCIAKVATASREDAKMVREAKKAAKVAERQEWQARLQAARQAILDRPDWFADQPHPWKDGKTLRDDVLYRCSGLAPQAERRKAIVQIERAINQA